MNYFSPKDYLRLLLSLLPRGKAWNRKADALLMEGGPFGGDFYVDFMGAMAGWATKQPSTLAEVLYASGHELSRVDERGYKLSVERDTRYTDELLLEHEADFGLPDPCMEDAELTLEQRRQILWLKLRAVGQQNKEYFGSLAESLGYGNVIVEEFRPGWSGVLRAGEPCGDQKNIFYWKIWMGQDTEWQIYYFTCGASECGSYLSWLPLAQTIECLIAERYKPAHTKVLWGYYGYQFFRSFDFSFLALPPMQVESPDGLFGAFAWGMFSTAYDALWGGSFIGDFSGAFSKNYVTPPSLDKEGNEIILVTDASNRDGDEEFSSGNVDIVRATVYVGIGADRYHSCFQFKIPYGKDMMISRATLVGYWTNRLAENRVTIFVEDSDDAAVIAAGAGSYDISGRSVVGGFGISWTVPAGPDGWLRSPNFGPLLQYVLNRSGWNKNQYMSVIIRDSLSGGGAAGGEGRVASYDGAVASRPELRIDGYLPGISGNEEMATFKVDQSAGDGRECYESGVTQILGPTNAIGNFAGIGTTYMSAVQFVVELPGMAVILEAKLRYYIHIIGGAGTTGRIRYESTPNSSVIAAAVGNISQRNKSVAYVEHTPSGVGWATIDITDLVQQWHSLGFQSGDRITLVIEDAKRVNFDYYEFRGYDFAPVPSDYRPELTVKYIRPEMW